MRQYTIAGEIIQISGEGLETLPGFDCFASHNVSDLESPGNILLTISGLRTDAETPLIPGRDIPSGFTLTSKDESKSYRFFAKDNGYLFLIKRTDGYCLSAEINRRGNAFQSSIRWNDDFGAESLTYICWIMFGVAILSRQTVPFHASAVMYKNKTVLFLGESGTGKSTHTRLWLKHIPDTELLNDDCPFVRVEPDAGIQAYGSPWSGKTPCYKNKHTPVAAFVRLSQAPCNRIRRLTGIDAIGALLPSCPLTFTSDKQLSESIYAILSKVLQQTPVYYLECLPDTAAAQSVFETLNRDKIL